MNTQDFLASYTKRFVDNKEEDLSLDEYLELCKTDPSAYANPAERLLMAIGTPEMIDTRHDPVLSRIFSNKVIQRYTVFQDFYGMEEPIEQIVGFCDQLLRIDKRASGTADESHVLRHFKSADQFL